MLPIGEKLKIEFLLGEAGGDVLFVPLPHDPAVLPDRHEAAADGEWPPSVFRALAM